MCAKTSKRSDLYSAKNTNKIEGSWSCIVLILETLSTDVIQIFHAINCTIQWGIHL